MTKPLVQVVSMLFEANQDVLVKTNNGNELIYQAVNEVIDVIRPLDAYYCKTVQLQIINKEFTTTGGPIVNVRFEGTPESKKHEELMQCAKARRGERHSEHPWEIVNNDFGPLNVWVLCEGHD